VKYLGKVLQYHEDSRAGRHSWGAHHASLQAKGWGKVVCIGDDILATATDKKARHDHTIILSVARKGVLGGGNPLTELAAAVEAPEVLVMHIAFALRTLIGGWWNWDKGWKKCPRRLRFSSQRKKGGALAYELLILKADVVKARAEVKIRKGRVKDRKRYLKWARESRETAIKALARKEEAVAAMEAKIAAEKAV
jgi:hypothetical protein